MDTTAIVAEILVAGLEAATWLLLLVAWAVGPRWSDLEKLKDWVPLVTVWVIAVTYAIGIVVDRVADTLYDATLKLKLEDLDVKKNQVREMRVRVLREEKALAPFLEYQRSRQRIARSTVLNTPLILVFGHLFLNCRLRASGYALALFDVTMLILFMMSAFAARRIERAYLKFLRDASTGLPMQTVREANESEDAASGGRSRAGGARMRAAAVCYRRRDGRLEFLIVRTQGARFWTFPKGHVEKDEQPHEAAAREAREEAGVSGNVGTEELVRYRFPRKGAGEDVEVWAYLLEVTGEKTPEEPQRGPVWLTPEETRARLAEGRAPFYADEHARVVAAALAKLRP